MDEFCSEVQVDPELAKLTIDARRTARSARVLSSQEVSSVAGGPEGDVGNGVTPP